MPKPFKAACVQYCAKPEIEKNLDASLRLSREAAARGAKFVALPEYASGLATDGARLVPTALPEKGHPFLAAYGALARELGLYVLLGSLAIDEADGRIANRAYVIDPSGRVTATYDKIHLFDVDLPGGESWRESATYVPGDRAVVADLPWLKLGVSICYDIRFPQLFRAQAHAGATALTAPAAFTRQTGEAHWHVLQRARAIENGAFVISAAQAGRHADGRETFGHSIIVAPWGEILAEAGGQGPEVIVAEIDPARATDVRQRIPSLRNERPFALPDAPVRTQIRSAS